MMESMLWAGWAEEARAEAKSTVAATRRQTMQRIVDSTKDTLRGAEFFYERAMKSPVPPMAGNQVSKVATLASEISTQVSTAEAVVEGHALKNAKSGFKIKNLGIAAGIAVLGAAVIGAGVGAAKMASNSLDGGSRHQSGTFHQHEAGFDKDQMEQFISSTSVRTRNAPTPSLSTNVQVEDADLDMDHVDRMFTNHFKTGYAYSTTPIE